MKRVLIFLLVALLCGCGKNPLIAALENKSGTSDKEKNVIDYRYIEAVARNNGATKSGVIITITSPAQEVKQGQTDASGNIKFENLIEGSYIVKVSAGDYWYEYTTTDVVVSKSKKTSIAVNITDKTDEVSYTKTVTADNGVSYATNIKYSRPANAVSTVMYFQMPTYIVADGATYDVDRATYWQKSWGSTQLMKFYSEFGTAGSTKSESTDTYSYTITLRSYSWSKEYVIYP